MHILRRLTGNLTKNLQKPWAQRQLPTQKRGEVPALHTSQIRQSTNLQRKSVDRFL